MLAEFLGLCGPVVREVVKAETEGGHSWWLQKHGHVQNKAQWDMLETAGSDLPIFRTLCSFSLQRDGDQASCLSLVFLF